MSNPPPPLPPSSSSPSPIKEIRNRDMLALRSFVTAQDHKINESIISLDLTHSNLQQRHLEARFALNATLYDLRLRVYQTTGTLLCDQNLQFYYNYAANAPDFNNNAPALEIPAHLYNDSDSQMPLVSFMPPVHAAQHRCRVHCIDTNPFSTSARGALENVALVEKFRMSDATYDARPNTLRAWSKQQKNADPSFTYERYAQQQRELMEARMRYQRGFPLPLGFEVNAENQVVRIVSHESDDDDDDGTDTADQHESTLTDYDESSIRHAIVSSRCEVAPGRRRGVVRWTGQIQGKSGHWVGVELDEPLGHNDGSLGEVRYFQAQEKRGCFVRGFKLSVGDYPERDLLDDEESDSDDEI